MTLATENLAVPGRLHGVSLSLRAGEVTAILGPNGAGKSTLLSALAGLLPGPVSLDGNLLGQLPASVRAQTIGYLPQSGEVAWNLSVESLAALGRLPHRTAPAQDAQAIDAALAALDLDDLRHRPVAELSGGERARALLARVLAGTPRWILADEPLASLDLAHQQALLHRFRALAQRGQGIVLVLHDLAQAMNHADRVIVLDRGFVVADGLPDDVLDPVLIEQVWGLQAQWLGEPGHRALAC
ncbi:ABC transporter ATP-binding protein [Novosphingobium cyanobacteriorum]|uniref:ABC transporter ATP-binding protein n=1 Tax=Novosphingobium cyanobacteriorum TaxID=3024215 RepID=A0ABT6CEU8_9SPHN|nr:ABC transporter ATP-binding protein [Novosphingobium cyanobacteriorum]MDF8332326.1 ABC transporter ATP-binding protein [Novosphingobium cyanobacteriorum]